MNTFKTYFFLFVISLGLFTTGCVDNDFDEPENTLKINDDEVISISDVLDLLDSGGSVLLDESNIGEKPMYIRATINADDASGNFYRTISFQDATGGLSIIPDRNELNAEFPMGNIVYVKLQGLTLGNDRGLPRLGYGVTGGEVQRIPDILINDFMIPGGKGDELVPEVTTITNFISNAPQYYNKLIQLDNVEFTDAWVGQTFADADNTEGPRGENTIISDCGDNEIILRNSGFADFASNIIPFQNGSLIAVASIYEDEFQLFIRNTNDIKFADERCDGSGGMQTGDEITIQSIQDRYYDLGADKAEAGFITGTVISDKNTGQVHALNVFLQNGEDGILVRFSGEHNFQIGAQLKINVTGQEVSEYQNILQLNNIPLFNVEVTGTGELPAPKELTVDEILLDNNKYESTRVLIKGATLNGPSTFAGNVFVDDGTEEIIIFTFNTTSYANESVPSGKVDVTAIVSQYNDVVQLVINGPSDISGGTVIPGGDKVTTGFEDYSNGDPINKEGWMTVATKGNRTWFSSSHEDERYAECEAYEDTNPETESWLITPSIDTDNKSIFSFQTAQAFWQHQGLTVWISMDFSDFSNANWISLDQANIASNSDEFFTLVNSGDIDLKDYFGGTVRVGFKYEGTAASNTTKMRIDNVVLK